MLHINVYIVQYDYVPNTDRFIEMYSVCMCVLIYFYAHTHTLMTYRRWVSCVWAACLFHALSSRESGIDHPTTTKDSVSICSVSELSPFGTCRKRLNRREWSPLVPWHIWTCWNWPHLVGALEHFWLFSRNIGNFNEFHHPKWRSHIFQRGGSTTNQPFLLFLFQPSQETGPGHPTHSPLSTSRVCRSQGFCKFFVARREGTEGSPILDCSNMIKMRYHFRGCNWYCIVRNLLIYCSGDCCKWFYMYTCSIIVLS